MARFTKPPIVCRRCKQSRGVHEFGKTATMCRYCQSSYSKRFRPFLSPRQRKKLTTIERLERDWIKRGIRLPDGSPFTNAHYQYHKSAQNSECKICKRVIKQRLDVDHDYKTGFFRGLLCRKCNTGIGLLGDMPVRIRRAADYIETYGVGK